MTYTRLGSKIAGWYVDLSLLNKNSIVYSAGLGVDITFEQELIKTVGCTVHGFDPTPGGVRAALRALKNPKFIIHEIGFAETDRTAHFSPLHPEWGTYTEHNDLIVKASPPALSEDVPLKSIPTVLKELGHNHIDLLKIDIEGTEYEVIGNMFYTNKDTYPVKQFLVEWHKSPKDTNWTHALVHLQNAGFTLGHADGINFSFVR